MPLSLVGWVMGLIIYLEQVNKFLRAPVCIKRVSNFKVFGVDGRPFVFMMHFQIFNSAKEM